MSAYIVTDTELTSVANAIRTKGSTQAQLSFPSAFVTAIGNLPTASGCRIQFISDGSVYSTSYIPAGDSVNAPHTNPTKSGMFFKGWVATQSGTSILTFPQTVNANTTFYAYFAELLGYKAVNITFDVWKNFLANNGFTSESNPFICDTTLINTIGNSYTVTKSYTAYDDVLGYWNNQYYSWGGSRNINFETSRVDFVYTEGLIPIYE